MALDAYNRQGYTAVFFFKKSTCDTVTLVFLKFDMQQGALATRQMLKNHSDMRHEHFLNWARDIVMSKQQGHATLSFLKIDMRHQDPPSRAPHLARDPSCHSRPLAEGGGASSFGTRPQGQSVPHTSDRAGWPPPDSQGLTVRGALKGGGS